MSRYMKMKEKLLNGNESYDWSWCIYKYEFPKLEPGADCVFLNFWDKALIGHVPEPFRKPVNLKWLQTSPSP